MEHTRYSHIKFLESAVDGVFTSLPIEFIIGTVLLKISSNRLKYDWIRF